MICSLIYIFSFLGILPIALIMQRVVISNHSQQNDLSENLVKSLQSTSCDVITINEYFPEEVKHREQAIRWCEMFVVVASVRYQRHTYCLELANYAKTIRKPIITILGQTNYKPFGTLGAIAVAGGTTIDFTRKEDFESNVTRLKKEVEVKSVSSSTSKPEIPKSGFVANANKTATKCSGVFVSYQSDTTNIAKMIEAALISNGGSTLGNPTKSNDEAIIGCQVFVAVLSREYQSSEQSQASYELARAYRKNIVPVIGAKEYTPSGWLALAIAGKLYYSMPDHETAYKPFYDSSLMNDFCYAVKAFLQPQASEEERESSEIAALDKQLEDCKKKLQQWPPQPRPKEEEQAAAVTQAETAVAEMKVTADKKNLPFNYIHHEVTRMSFVPPKPLFDARGVPLRRTFDVMCSYQWDIQRFVRNFYMDLHMRNVEVWMDIWGGMQGNINESMANAVECSAVIICFLTEKYQKSVNCCLELKYALDRQKPIIFIKVEPSLVLLPWISDVVARSQVFEMSSISDAGKKDDGIPRINRIAELTRVYVTKRPRRPIEDDVTEEVFARRDMLEDALYWIHHNQGTARFIKCGRCGAEFDDNSMEGCKRHSSYFMGGTIMAGRWMCCQQRSKDSPGCSKAKHTTTVKKWAQIPGHGGCFNWS